MSLVDSLKKGLFGSEDEHEDQYIDDGPQMVNNNNGVGLGADDETEEPAEGAKKNKVVNIHATTQLKVVLVKPERFEDASTIADHLNNKRTVVLNLSPPTRKCPAVWWTSCPVWPMPTTARSSVWPTAPSSSPRTT